MHKLTLIAFCLGLFGLPSLADEPTPCPMTHERFELAVPHLDLESCTGELAGTARFCRAAVGNDMLHVYVFAEKGDQCLLATRSFDEERFTLKVK